jgi:L-lactate dehydrogenase complex protein LldG
MSAAREAILKAAAKALPRTRPDAATISSEARLLIGNPQTVRPALPLPGVTESFLLRVSASKASATVERITAIAGLPETVARHLQARGLPVRIALQPSPHLAVLDWASVGLSCDGPTSDGIVVGLARWGIAEYGSLVFHSAVDTPILLNFLPAVHIVAVHASTIVGYLEDYAAAAELAGDPAPRNACLITGASGTTDIEGNLVLGAHGPRELHIVVIDEAPAVAEVASVSI